MSDRPNPPLSVTLGFLTVFQEPTGWLGGYLVTNGWGRPLEFRLSTAVQPNKVQHALYGPTLVEYLHADLIGKTLVEKTTAKPDLIVADAVAAVGLWARVGIPTVAFRPSEGERGRHGDTGTRGQGDTETGRQDAEPSGLSPYLPVSLSPCLPVSRSPPLLVSFTHPRSAVPLVFGAAFAADEADVVRLLDAVDPAVDLAEPFARIREAVAEARKMGVTNRAA